jgi:hypothetical protein
MMVVVSEWWWWLAVVQNQIRARLQMPIITGLKFGGAFGFARDRRMRVGTTQIGPLLS